jgi:hypothetical protein
MWKTLKIWMTNNVFLISHAGFHPDLIGKIPYKLSWRDKLKVVEENLKQVPFQDMLMIGRSRGGYYPYGGPLWMDWYDEFKNSERIKQVVGHTARRKSGDNLGITRRRLSSNIDCLDRKQEVLSIMNGTAHKKRFELSKKIIV